MMILKILFIWINYFKNIFETQRKTGVDLISTKRILLYIALSSWRNIQLSFDGLFFFPCFLAFFYISLPFLFYAGHLAAAWSAAFCPSFLLAWLGPSSITNPVNLGTTPSVHVKKLVGETTMMISGQLGIDSMVINSRFRSEATSGDITSMTNLWSLQILLLSTLDSDQKPHVRRHYEHDRSVEPLNLPFSVVLAKSLFRLR